MNTFKMHYAYFGMLDLGNRQTSELVSDVSSVHSNLIQMFSR